MESTDDYIKCTNSGTNKPRATAPCAKETICVSLTLIKNSTNKNTYCFCPHTKVFLTKENNKCQKPKAGSHSNGITGPIQLTEFINTSKLENATNFSMTEQSITTSSVDYSTNLPYVNLTNITTNSTSEDITKAANFFGVSTHVWIIIPVVILVMALVLFLLSKYFLCNLFGLRKLKSNKNKTNASTSNQTVPIVQSGRIVLTDQRYTTNPSYSSHLSAPPMDISIGLVPLLSRNSITDLEKIGEGFFGEVFKGQLHSIDDEKEHVETVAVKRLKQTANLEALEDFLREVEIISSFQHPNILTLVGVCPQESLSPPWMIFEYMSFGDLADVLRNSNHNFSNSDRHLPTLSAEALLSISLQIAAGMEYLAAQRFVHRDLACRNCLVGSALTVKISDFGMSRDVYTCDYYRVGGNRMLPIRWMSPEGLAYGKFTLESDVWSYGVVLWEIYNYGKQPYYGYTNEQAMKLIGNNIQLEVPENCPHEVADIMRSCWQINPKDRIQFLDICNSLSALKECIDEISITPLPRPPPMPVTINYPPPFDDEEFDDILDDDNYVKLASARSSLFIEPSDSSFKRSNSSNNAYIETLP